MKTIAAVIAVLLSVTAARAAAPAETTPAAPAPAPAPAPKSLSAKEIYEADAKSVVLILAGNSGGQGELGTGSVIDATGRVLTNAHVVIDDKTHEPYPVIRVYLKPARVTGDAKTDMVDPISAKVARYDRALDLAVLDLSRAPNVPALNLGDDAGVETGDPVVAIGHPEQGGLWTLTQGVISTVVADLGGVPGKNAFQTDASINRGNSGGPLIDRTGGIVGINTSMARKAADGLTITSVNFSIKSSVARAWLDRQSQTDSAAAAPAAPVAEAPALPPAPKTKPAILTPAKPYRIEDVVEEGMKEMDQQSDEMHDEIQKRLAPAPTR
ncbi:MAG: trypsin-like peptidase domain-containing protein [Elusimicrobia bacterium]|nr:trypsin-like peptidase domain-containing protein [Elusimicrobiota bacterium]